ncbi:unnamed protein product, partial [Meganyctiphanes norvegica]
MNENRVGKFEKPYMTVAFKYCGSDSPNSVTLTEDVAVQKSTTLSISLKFTYRKFHSSGRVVRVLKQMVGSQNQPMMLTGHMCPMPYTFSQCQWDTCANPSSGSITVTCSAFAMQPSRRGRCRDYLKIGKTKYCGSDGPNSVAVTVRRFLKISFKSDRRLNNLGFTCTATVGGTVVTLPPVVTNPPSGRCVCGKANRGTRIVGGQTTEVNEYPWQVALVSRGSSGVFCGGSLINDRWVLTAAHCTQSG